MPQNKMTRMMTFMWEMNLNENADKVDKRHIISWTGPARRGHMLVYPEYWYYLFLNLVQVFEKWPQKLQSGNVFFTQTQNYIMMINLIQEIKLRNKDV